MVRLRWYPDERLKREIIEIIGRHLDLKIHKVFLFGSRAAGAEDDRSDIDIGVEGHEAVHFDVMGRIREELESLPILYKIDVVDFKRVSPEFREVAMRSIEKITP